GAGGTRPTREGDRRARRWRPPHGPLRAPARRRVVREGWGDGRGGRSRGSISGRGPGAGRGGSETVQQAKCPGLRPSLCSALELHPRGGVEGFLAAEEEDD